MGKRKSMLKRVLIILLSLLILLNLSACGNNDNNQIDNNEEDIKEETNNENNDVVETGKSLVIYFSLEGEQYRVGVIEKGNTEIVAEMIKDLTDADIFEVEPKEAYPNTYNELIEVAQTEQDNNARPEYINELPDLKDYSTIFIGSPVWWGDWPMIMYTIFDNYDFSDKNLVPFSTHEGSGLSGFDSKLKEAEPNATILEGIGIRGSDAQNDQDKVKETLKTWLKDLGY